MTDHGTLPPFAKGTASAVAADVVAIFLVAWEEAASSYELLLSNGFAPDDCALSKDQNYRRLLKAGQEIHWIGGAEAVGTAAQMIARLVPDGSRTHFDRLWCGLLPTDPA